MFFNKNSFSMAFIMHNKVQDKVFLLKKLLLVIFFFFFFFLIEKMKHIY